MSMNLTLNPIKNPDFEFIRLMREETEKTITLLKNESLSLDERVHQFPDLS